MISMKHNGFEEAIKQMEKLTKKAVYEAQFAMMKDAEYITHSVKMITPVDTGRLKASYNYKIIKDSPKFTHIRIDTDVPYSKFVEFGTYKQKAQPHFTPVVIRHLPKVPKNMLSAIKKVTK